MATKFAYGMFEGMLIGFQQQQNNTTMDVKTLDIKLGTKYEICDKNNIRVLVIITEEQKIFTCEKNYTGEQYECYTINHHTQEEEERAMLYIEKSYNCAFYMSETQETIDVIDIVKINDTENALLKMKNAAAEED